ncbi:hypothetical protein LAD77_00210 [Klebsiella pneumoniae]|nr:hypothetical protein [Klebsiella pneumoniae]
MAQIAHVAGLAAAEGWRQQRLAPCCQAPIFAANRAAAYKRTIAGAGAIRPDISEEAVAA